MEGKSNLQILKELCPSLEKELLKEIIDTFQNFAETNFDEEDDEGGDISTQMSTMQITEQKSEMMVCTKDFQVLSGMMLAMGCDISHQKARELYERFRDPKGPADTLSLSLTQYA